MGHVRANRRIWRKSTTKMTRIWRKKTNGNNLYTSLKVQTRDGDPINCQKNDDKDPPRGSSRRRGNIRASTNGSVWGVKDLRASPRDKARNRRIRTPKGMSNDEIHELTNLMCFVTNNRAERVTLLKIALALPYLNKSNKNGKNNSTSKMERAAKSVLAKLSRQKPNKSRRANARFFANVRRNKKSKLSREVGAVPRRTNIGKDPAHGGNFGDNRDSTNGEVVLVQKVDDTTTRRKKLVIEIPARVPRLQTVVTSPKGSLMQISKLSPPGAPTPRKIDNAVGYNLVQKVDDTTTRRKKIVIEIPVSMPRLQTVVTPSGSRTKKSKPSPPGAPTPRKIDNAVGNNPTRWKKYAFDEIPARVPRLRVARKKKSKTVPPSPASQSDLQHLTFEPGEELMGW